MSIYTPKDAHLASNSRSKRPPTHYPIPGLVRHGHSTFSSWPFQFIYPHFISGSPLLLHHCKFYPLPWKKGCNLYNIGPVHPRGSSPPFSNTLPPLLQQFSSHVLLLLYRNGNCYNHNTMLLVFISSVSCSGVSFAAHLQIAARVALPCPDI